MLPVKKPVFINPFIPSAPGRLVQEVRKAISWRSHPILWPVEPLTMPSFIHKCSNPPCNRAAKFACHAVTKAIEAHLERNNIRFQCPCDNVACLHFNYCKGDGFFSTTVWPGWPLSTPFSTPPNGSTNRARPLDGSVTGQNPTNYERTREQLELSLVPSCAWLLYANSAEDSRSDQLLKL
ncbi:hypothetical protein NP233_g62 [Leucocoprinus birnbaumii]|uniref:Uncharacterized protein n=1 Tax=Leucocoprinus birnbaumii TaxID=56174 RepID=A0AAD5W2W1_9AGAR|nr:hypothetical protein NP233_g62 [Leucocoprinus birnbaumii]